jgi:hypothetical protein
MVALLLYNLFRVLPEIGATICDASRLPLSVCFSGLYRQKEKRPLHPISGYQTFTSNALALYFHDSMVGKRP